LITIQAARKEYVCDLCHKLIGVGETYLRQADPAWEDYEADVDEEGRPVGYLRAPEERKWMVHRYHEPGCSGDPDRIF
jgi:hypothetical protein